MSTDTPEFWNEMWADIEDCGSGSDAILADQIEHLTPGRALDMGCGTGGNAIWLAKQGWQVTAVDHSEVAIEKGKRLAAEEEVNVEFILAAASTYRPMGHYHLTTSFYIQMFPQERINMLAQMSKALAPGGTLLFVSHDKSGPPIGWTEEDLLSLTTPEEIVAELPDLQIERAFVLDDDQSGGHASHMRQAGAISETHSAHDSHGASSTVVRAVRP
ncbi:MAG: hypothetical protein BZY87_02360 [SAR202 cluster bacterium Io17-Chloro-G6]|nr:MAG: hypothetical protein BZY87_02360 [SAR202 cluster bacterium Io17-Chloro-G6]